MRGCERVRVTGGQEVSVRTSGCQGGGMAFGDDGSEWDAETLSDHQGHLGSGPGPGPRLGLG